MSAIAPPPGRVWWKQPLDRVEGTWIVIACGFADAPTVATSTMPITTKTATDADGLTGTLLLGLRSAVASHERYVEPVRTDSASFDERVSGYARAVAET